MSLGPSPVSLLTLPGGDVVLRTLAQLVMERGCPTPACLAEVLRPLYPEVHVRPQHELAAVAGERVWYVFRDGMLRVTRDGGWPTGADWADPAVAHVVMDDDGRLAEANGPAGRLFGVAPDELVGLRVRDLCDPAACEVVDALIPLLRREDVLETRWLMSFPAAGSAYVDFRLVRDGDGRHRHIASLRSFPLEAPAGTRSLTAAGSGESVGPALVT